MIEKLYTVEEVAELASVTGRTIRNYLKSGRLVGRKIGGQWRFPEAEVQRLLTGAEPEAEAAAETPAPEAPQAEAPAQLAAPVLEPPCDTIEAAAPLAHTPAQPEALDYSDDPAPIEDDSPIYDEAAPPEPAPRPVGGYHAQPAPLPQPQAAAIQQAPTAAPQPQQQAPVVPPGQVQTVYGQPAYPQPAPPQATQPQPVAAYTPGDAPPTATSGYATFEQPPVQPQQAAEPPQNHPAYVVPVIPPQAAIPPQYDNMPVQSYTFAAPAPVQYPAGMPGYYILPQAMLGVTQAAAPEAATKSSDDKPEKLAETPVQKPKPATPELSDVGNRVTRFMSQVHDCSYGPAMCAVIDMNQSLESAKITSERLNEIADMESNEHQPCQCFVEFDDRYFIARYTLFGSTHFLLRCLKLIG